LIAQAEYDWMRNGFSCNLRMRAVLRNDQGRIALACISAFAFWLFVVLPLLYFPWQGLVDSSGKFGGLDNTAWTAIGALANTVLALLTTGLLFFAIYQVLSVKRDAKINRTLAACERYDIDPVLDQITRRLSIAEDDGCLRSNPKSYSVDLNSLFNYFESLAIGVDRGHYDADIVRDQFETIMIAHIESMDGVGNWSRVSSGPRDIDHFDKMMALYANWKGNPC
jgi:hypothetical protein